VRIQVLVALLGFLGSSLAAEPAVSVERSNAAPAPEVVILLHGLGRSDRSMRPLESHLSQAGYRVRNLRYPSRDLTPEELVANLHRQIAACCTGAPRLHFVTHSLGGVLIRAYLAEHSLPNLGRVVMLAPPNRGSEYVDLVGDSRLFQWAFGPTATELGTGSDSLPNRLPKPRFEFGVIAGTRSINPLSPLVVHGESDGTVSVESAQIAGMSDFITVPVSHTFIMRSDTVAGYVIGFLRTGRFLSGAP